MLSPVTTHVLDIASGSPAAGIAVFLERQTHTVGWERIAEGITNTDGRISDFLAPADVFSPGLYRLIFETGPYFLLHDIEGFYPQVTISFIVKVTGQHYHVPLLLSPFGYSTYRGS